jgi:RNA polymerase sigma factor (TIGR02999 family)
MTSDSLPIDAESLLIQTYRDKKESPEQLFALLYNELRQVARAYMRRERADHTMQATALVNEAYIRLFDGQGFEWENRQHLFCVVARSMRRLLVDYGRRRGRPRHGGAFRRVSIDDQGPAIYQDIPRFLILNDALDRLAELNPRQARVVELHAFAGLSESEIAEILGVSVRTIKRDWSFARVWLKAEIGEDRNDTAASRTDTGDI